MYLHARKVDPGNAGFCCFSAGAGGGGVGGVGGGGGGGGELGGIFVYLSPRY